MLFRRSSLWRNEMSEGEDKVVVSGESEKKPFQRIFESPPREVVSSEGDIDQCEAENEEIENDHALENAICDARKETLRILLEELKRIARKRMMGQFSLKEIEVVVNSLVDAVGALNFNNGSDVEKDLRESSKKPIDSDRAPLKEQPEGWKSTNIQEAMIRALHPEGEEERDEDSPESDEELLARMREQSPGFAKLVRRGFEKIE